MEEKEMGEGGDVRERRRVERREVRRPLSEEVQRIGGGLRRGR